MLFLQTITYPKNNTEESTLYMDIQHGSFIEKLILLEVQQFPNTHA